MPKWMRMAALCTLVFYQASCRAGAMQGVQSSDTIRTGTDPVISGDMPGIDDNPNGTLPATDANLVVISDPNLMPDGNTIANPNGPFNPNTVLIGKKGPGLAMYWGTGNYQGQDADFATVCNTPQYDIIIMSFAHSIGSNTRNAGGYPEMYISGCSGGYDAANPYLPNCRNVGALIPTCQKAGKQVILSLGGGGAKVGFKSDAEARAYAKLMWDMVLGGKGPVRPFGNAVLDGIDLDIEGGNAAGYGAFVLALRALMDADTSKKYLITAAPQCVFPDAWMGPGPGTALTMAPEAFDHLFIQFYNNDCRFANRTYFDKTYTQWSTFSPTKQPKIWIGLPGSTDAAMVADFITPANLPGLVKVGAAKPTYGGIMVWDAGYDLVDAKPGAAPYSKSIASAHNTLISITP